MTRLSSYMFHRISKWKNPFDYFCCRLPTVYKQADCFQRGPFVPDEGEGHSPTADSGSGIGLNPLDKTAGQNFPILHVTSSPRKKPRSAIYMYTQVHKSRFTDKSAAFANSVCGRNPIADRTTSADN